MGAAPRQRGNREAECLRSLIGDAKHCPGKNEAVSCDDEIRCEVGQFINGFLGFEIDRLIYGQPVFQGDLLNFVWNQFRPLPEGRSGWVYTAVTR